MPSGYILATARPTCPRTGGGTTKSLIYAGTLPAPQPNGAILSGHTARAAPQQPQLQRSPQRSEIRFHRIGQELHRWLACKTSVSNWSVRITFESRHRLVHTVTKHNLPSPCSVTFITGPANINQNVPP